MSSRSMQRGFMEPIRHTTYFEDIYTRMKAGDEHIEDRAFDFCEDSSDDEKNVAPSKQSRKNLKQLESYGSIKKPKYKPRAEVNRQEVYKIAPNRNAKHSVSLLSPGSEDEAQPKHPDVPTAQKTTNPFDVLEESAAEVFMREKDRQRQLSGASRFDRVRKKRLGNRARIHTVGQKARKTHERVLRSTAAAEACLVETFPMASRLYVLVKSGEGPEDFIDFTVQRAGGAKAEMGVKKKTKPSSSGGLRRSGRVRR